MLAALRRFRAGHRVRAGGAGRVHLALAAPVHRPAYCRLHLSIFRRTAYCRLDLSIFARPAYCSFDSLIFIAVPTADYCFIDFCRLAYCRLDLSNFARSAYCRNHLLIFRSPLSKAYNNPEVFTVID